MGDSSIPFDEKGCYLIPSAHDGEVCLHKSSWEHILGGHKANRFDLNWEKIPTTLVVPDEFRLSVRDPEIRLYFKQFSSYKKSEGITVPIPPYWKYCMVVVQIKKKFVMTAYEVPGIKTNG
jgi:hypothetical protein